MNVSDSLQLTDEVVEDLRDMLRACTPTHGEGMTMTRETRSRLRLALRNRLNYRAAYTELRAENARLRDQNTQMRGAILQVLGSVEWIAGRRERWVIDDDRLLALERAVRELPSPPEPLASQGEA